MKLSSLLLLTLVLGGCGKHEYSGWFYHAPIGDISERSTEMPPAPYLCPNNSGESCAIKKIQAWAYLSPKNKLIGVCAKYEGQTVCTANQLPKDLQ